MKIRKKRFPKGYLKLEHKIYPEAIRLFSEGRLEVRGRIVKIKGKASSQSHLANPSLKE